MIIEAPDQRVRLLAWGLQQEGLDVHVAAPSSTPDEVTFPSAGPPDVVLFNTRMPAAVKRLWIGAIRSLAPQARVVDLAGENLDGAPDSGADVRLYDPVRISDLVAVIREHASRQVDGASRGEERG